MEILYRLSIFGLLVSTIEGLLFNEKFSFKPELNVEDGLPILTLEYGRYQAKTYDTLRDIYVFKNIRYGAPPTGNLRWRAPQVPAYNATISDGSYGNQCFQAAPPSLNVLGPFNQFSTPAGIINGFVDGVLPIVLSGGDEDCLFLDLYVPGKAIRDASSRLPVVVWIYGGAYILGSKDQGANILPLYKGNGPIQESNNEIIFISFNYRLGAFGFLAGTTMEEQGVPNAGYHDQHAVFKWVQKYIQLVGGDKDDVTAWGESAGAGSILGQLTAFGGRQDPLFRKAVMQSIASEVLVDRRGNLEETFRQFASDAGCAGQDLSCLRNVPASNLAAANKKLVASPPLGAFTPGPASDGMWARQAPALELASGNYWKNISGLILSHVSNEPTLFVTGGVKTDEQFNRLVDFIVPSYAKDVRKKIEAFFPSPNQSNTNYTTQTSRVEAYMGTTTFLCNYRYLTDAYAGKTWNLQYSVTPGFHGTDLLPTFYDGSFNFSELVIPIVPGFGPLALAYQSYLTSFTRTGDPNKLRRSANIPPAIYWPRPTQKDAEMLHNVLNTGDLGFNVITDTKSLKSQCDFFLNAQAAITSRGGYSPPGSYVPNNLGVSSNGNPSRNYNIP